MHYIVLDLEFNQDFSKVSEHNVGSSFFEIIQVGAVKLDENLNTLGTFQRNVKPSIYPAINPYITKLTGITTEQLSGAETFPAVYEDFADFSGGSDSIFCTWGMTDLKELFRNIKYHNLSHKIISKRYINLQPYVSLHFNLSKKKMMKLETAAERLSVPIVHPFHNALHDALYTAEIFKRISSTVVRPKRYDPEQVFNRTGRDGTRLRKREADFEKLVLQFEKMYGRELSREEKSMVILAYKMGKTQQFLKPEDYHTH